MQALCEKDKDCTQDIFDAFLSCQQQMEEIQARMQAELGELQKTVAESGQLMESQRHSVDTRDALLTGLGQLV